ncbi:MAG TPA: glycosyltransferase family 4 protein [Bryobacteraceae bacterium]|nr:glycosyltransferase family 4 protein [Bryobacteraceae bacterium]
MKILFLEQFGETGGGQRCLLDLLPAIRERSWSATVAAPAGPLLDLARAGSVGTTAICMGTYRNGHKSVRDTLAFALHTAQLARWIAARDADLIYVNAPRPLVAAALGSRGRPVIFHAHHFLEQGAAARVARWAIRRARATVIANSRHVAGQYSGERLHVIYNGVNPIPFMRKTFAPGGCWRIGVIGRIAPMKGQTDFLCAAAAIVAERAAHFLICGEPMFSQPDYCNEVRRLAEGLPVEFPGWREDMAVVLAGLDLLIVPSTAAESTTRVILEAWSAGVPVVAYAAGGIPEIVRDSVDGFLVPECEPGALARKILEVTRLDLAPVAERARVHFERGFTLDRWQQQVTSVISACVSTTADSNPAWERKAARAARRAS